MKKKIFKYKLVYWVSLITNFVTVGIFGFASYNRLSVGAYSNVRDIVFSTTTFSIAVTSLISLFFLLSKNRNSVKTFSIMLILLLSTFSIGILDSMIIKGDFDYDKFTISLVFFMYAITVGFLLMARKFRIKEDFRFVEIDEIGTKKNN